jgi:hypothetical protein
VGCGHAFVPFDDLVESVCVVTSVETYVRVVRFDGKSRAAYSTFVTRAIRDIALTR